MLVVVGEDAVRLMLGLQDLWRKYGSGLRFLAENPRLLLPQIPYDGQLASCLRAVVCVTASKLA